MKNSKIVIPILVAVLIVASFLLWIFVFKAKTTQDTQNQVNNTLTEKQTDDFVDTNFVKCDIDNKKSVIFKMISVNYMQSVDTTMFMAQGEIMSESDIAPVLQFSFPGKSARSYTMAKTDSNQGMHYGVTVEENWQTNFENSNSYQINVSKYENNHVEGTFSGEMTYLDQSGWNNEKKTNFQNCSFSSDLEIKSL